MILIDTDDGFDDMSDWEVSTFYATAQEEYCEAVTEEDDADWQQACADSVRKLSEEVRRRGIKSGWLH